MEEVPYDCQIDVHCENVDDGWIESLASGLSNCDSLKLFNFNQNIIGDKGGASLAIALPGTNVEYIFFLGNYLGDEAATQFGKVLANNQCKLRVLLLSSNQIGDKGAKEIANGLKTNSILETLEISDNKIGEEGVISIFDALRINQTLRILLINTLTPISPETLDQCRESLKENFTITQIIINSNSNDRLQDITTRNTELLQSKHFRETKAIVE